MQKTLLLLLATLGFVTLQAQTGAISGTILDTDGFPLIGANIVIEGTGTGSTTDFDGKYQFQADAGIYTLIASYIGYADQRFEDFEIKANDTQILDVILSEGGGVDMAEVVVTGARIENSEVAVMMIRRGSDKVQDVISAQEISRIGASNAAAALTKVTGTSIVDGKYVYVRGLGDRYSATTLNGLRLPSIDPYRNAAQLDLIPATVIDNIITSKTFTPDLPGDFTGGSVNIKLKALPERFTWGLSLSTSYNSQSNLRDDFLSFDAGRRAGLGFNDGSLDRPSLFSSSLIDDNEVLDNRSGRRARNNDVLAGLVDESVNAFGRPFSVPTQMSNGLDYKVAANIGTQLELGETRIGLFATGSYEKDYSQYQGGIRANYNNPGGSDVLFRDFYLVDNRSVESPRLNGMLGISIRPDNRNAINLYSVYSHQTDIIGRDLQGANDNFGVGGENAYFKSLATWFRERQMTSYVASGNHQLGQDGEGIKVEWAANYVSSFQEEPDIQFLAYTYDDGFQINTSQIPGPQRFFRNLNDDSYQAKLDFTLPILRQQGRGNFIKIGGLYNSKERDFNELAYEYLNRDGLTFDEAGGDPEVYFGAGNLGVIEQDQNGRNIVGLFIGDNSNLANSYVGSSKISAAYAMATLELTPSLKAIFGGRVENTEILVQSDIVSNELAQLEREPDSTRIADNTASINQAAFLPALNLVYKLNQNSNLRASFSQTLARPNMREIAPFGSFGFIGDPPVFGNPNLSLTRISNLDLRYEIYPEGGGEVFAVSAFYKDFKDPIVVTFRQSGQQQFTWTNSESAMLYGLELEFKKRLSFISPKLENFTFSSNFTYLQSEQKIDAQEVALARDVDPNFSDTRVFNGQSDYIINANLSYLSDNDWDMTLAYNYFGDRLQSIGAVGSPDIFERGRGQLDLSVSKTFNKLKVAIRGRNLLNPNYETFSEFNDATYVFSRYARGRDFSLSLGYKF